MSGIFKNGGLVRVQPLDGFTPDNKFNEYKNTSFEKADLNNYNNNNTGGVIRRFTGTVEIPVGVNDKGLKSNAVNPKPDELNKESIRPVLRAGPGNKKVDLKISYDEESPPEYAARDEVLAEYEQIKLALINEGEQAKNEAKSFAAGLIDKTQKDIRKLYDEANREAEEIKRKADEDGYKEGYGRGFDEGTEKGYSEGYNKGLRKCKDTLKELMTMLEEIPAQKDIVFKQYEHELFDAIFTIANKITVDSLKQKDKNVIQKMLREAAKSFRNSEYIKVSLSKLDVEEMGNAELDCLREIFRENQHVEFETVKDAPQGTLILDNGSEITDAGIATQLMMIEKLGKGKFRDKKAAEEDEG